MKNSLPLTIECNSHEKVPYSMVCIHLLASRGKIAIPIKVTDGREVKSDYCCSNCHQKYLAGKRRIGSLCLICTDCLKAVKKENRWIVMGGGMA